MSSVALTRARYLTVTGGVLAASVALPFLVHLLPPMGGVPAGARLLPIFLAPLIAILYRQPLAALTAALLAPYVNHLLTGMPASADVIVITVQLLVFGGVVTLLSRRPYLTLLAPAVYVGAYYLAPALLGALSALPGVQFTAGTTRPVASLVSMAWPGLLTILVVTAAALFTRPRR